MSTALVVHRGGWDASPADLAAVPVPADTDTWRAVPYPRLLEEVKLHIPRFGLTVEDERYALARDGNQMFGVLTCRNGHVSDWGLGGASAARTTAAWQSISWQEAACSSATTSRSTGRRGLRGSTRRTCSGICRT